MDIEQIRNNISTLIKNADDQGILEISSTIIKSGPDNYYLFQEFDREQLYKVYLNNKMNKSIAKLYLEKEMMTLNQLSGVYTQVFDKFKAQHAKWQNLVSDQEKTDNMELMARNTQPDINSREKQIYKFALYLYNFIHMNAFTLSNRNNQIKDNIYTFNQTIAQSNFYFNVPDSKTVDLSITCSSKLPASFLIYFFYFDRDFRRMSYFQKPQEYIMEDIRNGRIGYGNHIVCTTQESINFLLKYKNIYERNENDFLHKYRLCVYTTDGQQTFTYEGDDITGFSNNSVILKNNSSKKPKRMWFEERNYKWNIQKISTLNIKQTKTIQIRFDEEKTKYFQVVLQTDTEIQVSEMKFVEKE